MKKLPAFSKSLQVQDGHLLQHFTNFTMPPKASAHPKYEDMVKAAILALKDRNGSSVPAIAKYLAANYKLPDNFKKILSTQLKNLVKSGKLLKVKASYKLGEALKKAPKKPKKKAAPKKKKAAKKPKKKAAKKPKKAAKKPKKAAKKPAKKPKKAKKTASKKKYLSAIHSQRELQAKPAHKDEHA